MWPLWIFSSSADQVYLCSVPALAALPKQRVLVLSNYATSEMRAQALRLGVDRVFDKSQDVDALIDYCRQVGLDAKLP